MIWDQRYSTDEYVYGMDANDFLRLAVDHSQPGNALCLAEGEGRNAVWLAEQGFNVTAVDSSQVGLKKARQMAEKRGVTIQTIHQDLANFQILPNQWDLIISIFAHTPINIRSRIHHQVVKNLKTNGVFILEAYRPEQLNYKTGGPPTADLMMNLKTLQSELQGLEFQHAEELVREVHEGRLHHGEGSVVQIIARKP